MLSISRPIIGQLALALFMTGIQAAHAEGQFYRPFEVTGGGLKNPDEDIYGSREYEWHYVRQAASLG